MNPVVFVVQKKIPEALLAVIIFLFSGYHGISSEVSRMVPNPSITNLNLDSLPLQLIINQGNTEVYQFNKPISSVLSRNLNVIEFSINGNQMTVTGLHSGRTGLKITAEGIDYYMGIRVNNLDGSIPGLPDYLSVASVSEDTEPDLAFWKDIHPGLKNKAADIRYIYINGGPFAGWTSWDPDRPGHFATESLRHGLIPFYVFYNIPDSVESFARDSAHINDPEYMKAYFQNLNLFLDKTQSVMQGELFGVILEPDFLGYIKQNSHESSPDQFVTCVASDTIFPGAGNLTTLVTRINHTINQKKQQGYNVIYGWQFNLWATPYNGVNNIIRATDDLGFLLGKKAVRWSAQQTTLYGIEAGVLSRSASFLSIDKYGLDAGFVDTLDPANSTWFFNNDHWHNYLCFANTIRETSGYPVILWQLPIGHINATTSISAYTGQRFEPLDNTEKHYEDSTPDFFLGDAFIAENDVRIDYFSQNCWDDDALIVSEDTITWGSHMKTTADAGVVSAMFGAGVGLSTSGIGNPPTDQYFWIQKVQGYYLSGPVPVNWNAFNDCYGISGCKPNVSIHFPANGDDIIKSELKPIDVQVLAWSPSGQLQSLNLTVNGTTTSLDPAGFTHQHSWVPPAYGTYTIIAEANDGTNTGADTCVFEYIKFDPALCGYPLWQSDSIYPNAGMVVSWDGNIYQSKWWTRGDEPGTGVPWDNPWKYMGQCPLAIGVPDFSASSSIHSDVTIFPNPVQNSTCSIRIQQAHPGASWICSLRDNTGRLVVAPFTLKSAQKEINQTILLPTLSPGIYFLKLGSDREVLLKKLVVQD